MFEARMPRYDDQTAAPGHPADESDESDEALMGRIGAGDRLAFGALMQRHLARTVALARRMLGSESEAEDVAQEAFIRLWRSAARWQAPEEGMEGRPGQAKFSTWFYRVVTNLVIDRKRRKGAVNMEEMPEIEDEAPGPEAVAASAGTARLVRLAVADLPENQALALTLCFYEGLSNAQAAEAMGLSVKAIESLLVRARRTLRIELKAVHEAAL